MTACSVSENISSTKICLRCKEEKTIDLFGKHAKQKDGLSVYCKKCQQVYRSSWYFRNKEKQRELSYRWAELNKDRVKELQRNNYNENKERYAEKRKRMYEKHREKRLEYAKRSKTEKRGYYSQKQRLRDAGKVIAMPLWANKEKIDAIYVKAKLLEELDGIKRHVDHIIPLNNKIVSGLHCEFNLQILTAKDNIKKKNKFDANLYNHDF